MSKKRLPKKGRQVPKNVLRLPDTELLTALLYFTIGWPVLLAAIAGWRRCPIHKALQPKDGDHPGLRARRRKMDCAKAGILRASGDIMFFTARARAAMLPLNTASKGLARQTTDGAPRTRIRL